MIRIDILIRNNLYLGFKIKGHALSREEMESATGDVFDLVCNSVSVLSQSTLIGLEEVLKLPIKYEIKDGFLYLNLSNLNVEDIERAQVLLLTFEKSLESLMKTLKVSFGSKKDSEYIKIFKKEVQKIC